LAFKPNTDDIREAPAFHMIDALLSKGATVTAFDPEAMGNSKAYWGERIQFVENQYDALDHADALLIATEWNEFRTPDFEKIAGKLKQNIIFDGRNLFDLDSMEKTGFHYVSIGRKTIQAKS
jgi:UDPglucose 6-dehydrogenase